MVNVVHKDIPKFLLHEEVCPLLVIVVPTLQQELLIGDQMSIDFSLEIPHANDSQPTQKFRSYKAHLIN